MDLFFQIKIFVEFVDNLSQPWRLLYDYRWLGETKNSDKVHPNSSEVFKTEKTLGTAAEDHLSLKLSSTYHL